MQRARLLLADGSGLIVEALSKLLEPHFDVVGAVTDAPSLLDAAARLRPDVVILEANLPKRNAVNFGGELRNLLPNTRIVVLTTSKDPFRGTDSLQLWANAYLPRRCTFAELFSTIHDVLRGRTHVSPHISQRLLVRAPAAGDRPQITTRQKQVLQLLAHGHSMREIGARLGIKSRTVAFHKYEIMRECNLKSNIDIVAFAVRQRILSLPT